MSRDFCLLTLQNTIAAINITKQTIVARMSPIRDVERQYKQKDEFMGLNTHTNCIILADDMKTQNCNRKKSRP